MSVKYIAVVTY